MYIYICIDIYYSFSVYMCVSLIAYLFLVTFSLFQMLRLPPSLIFMFVTIPVAHIYIEFTN